MISLFPKHLWIVLTWTFIATTGSIQAQHDGDIDALVESLRHQQANAGVAVAVFSGQEVITTSLHGYRDVETKAPVTEQTLFMIGSTTKAMTATAAGYLVQDGQLAWDDLVRDHLPEFELYDKEAEANATIRDLLLHRTGLPRHDLAWLSREWSNERYLKLLPLLEPSTSFRGKWQYQNLMYMTVGMLVGKVANSSWEQVVGTRLFDNLDMHDSRALRTNIQPDDQVATAHVYDGNELTAIERRNIDGMGPAGSVHSSIRDMIKWGQFNLAKGHVSLGESLDPAILEEIHRPQIVMGLDGVQPEYSEPFRYGLGWMTSAYRGEPTVQHSGGIDGFDTDITLLPNRNLGIVVLTNGGELGSATIRHTVLDHYLGSEKIDWIKRLTPKAADEQSDPAGNELPESYQNVLGTYQHPAYGSLVLSETQREGNLTLEVRLNETIDFMVAPCLVASGEKLAYDRDGFVFDIELDSDLNGVRVVAKLEPTLDPLEFVRIPPKEHLNN